MRRRLLHRMASAQLLGLQHPVQRAFGQRAFQQIAAMAVYQVYMLRAQFHRGINDVLHHRLAGHGCNTLGRSEYMRVPLPAARITTLIALFDISNLITPF